MSAPTTVQLLSDLEIIHTKYYKTRKKLLGLAFIGLILIFILFTYILPDYLLKESELEVDTGIIRKTFMNKYLKRVRSATVYKTCLDVILAGKSYFIRFTDDYDNKYWEVINEETNISKTITVKFQSRLLHDNILYNPNEVLINNKVIIPADSKKWVLGLILIVLLIGISTCIYFFTSFLKIYKESLYTEDKETKRESLWKLVMVWIDD